MHKVVFQDRSGKYWRTELTEYQVKKDNNGRITLPDGFYSKGYYERLSDSVWEELPELQTYGSFKLSFTS